MLAEPIITKDKYNNCKWSDVVWLAHVYRTKYPGYRYGQAVYGILSENGQPGLPESWPELFYNEQINQVDDLIRHHFEINPFGYLGEADDG